MSNIAYTRSASLVALSVIVLLLSIPFSFARADTYPQLVDVSSNGTQADNQSYEAAMSADGRYVAFVSYAYNLVPNFIPLFHQSAVFVHDTVTGSTTLASVASDGRQGNSGSFNPFGDGGVSLSISASGRYVAFESYASDLVYGDTNGTYDVFVHDMLTGSTTRASVASNGTQGGLTFDSAISPDGRYVAFEWDNSTSKDDVMIHDMLTGSTTQVIGGGNGAPFFTADGQHLVSGAVIYDIATGSTTPASSTYYPWFTVSADGRYRVDGSYVHDTVTGAVASFDIATDGTPGTGGVLTDWLPYISADGRYIAFNSYSNLVPGDSNGVDIFKTTNPLFVSNQAPVLTPIGNKSVDEGQALTFTVAATDPDGDALTYSASNLPDGATFSTTTHTFSWTPRYDQAGNYPTVEFTVMDNGSPMKLAFEDIIITVGNVNRAPIFAPLGSQQVLEHELLNFTVAATDPDGDNVTLSAAGLPSGATFSTSTGAFSWTPGYPTAGVYVVTFTATDDGSPVASSTHDVVITVGSNPTPTEQSQNLVNGVVAAPLSTSIENSYLANLNKVATFIENGQVQSAINQLNAFIQKVEQDYSHGDITLAQRDYFVSLAQTLITDLQ